MNTQTIRRRVPLAALAIRGSHRARRHIERAALIARQLDQIAPGTGIVRTAPIWTDGSGAPRCSTWVELLTADGRPVDADLDAHRAALGLIRRAHPGVDWTIPHTYDARSGRLTTAPAAR
ncbi:hypothetical protein ACFQ61_01970 [Streptomyces sp. NPDC056500]|uniref:hypothetical protein n=1 Tax=Streptomyces sp. NPDC056500 TaxID=3345840 RepID=UPI0036CE523F